MKDAVLEWLSHLIAQQKKKSCFWSASESSRKRPYRVSSIRLKYMCLSVFTFQVHLFIDRNRIVNKWQLTNIQKLILKTPHGRFFNNRSINSLLIFKTPVTCVFLGSRCRNKLVWTYILTFDRFLRHRFQFSHYSSIDAFVLTL